MRKHIKEDKEREQRITMEIVVDAYSPEEQVMGWYCYLQDKMTFPFEARCIEEARSSPLKKGEKVEVTGMASEDYCRGKMFVEIDWAGRTVAVPLDQIDAPKADAETREAIADWHYWVGRGYQLG